MRRNYGKYTFGVGALFTLALLGGKEGLADPAYSQKSLSTPSTKSSSTPTAKSSGNSNTKSSSNSNTKSLSNSTAESLSAKPANNVYVGLSYSPAWHRIQNFSIGASDGSTAARYPSLQNAGPLTSNSFNWQVPDPAIRFRDNSVWAFEGSIGYKKDRARIEFELSYQEFETKASVLDSKNEITETIHLLAKDLAHYVVSGNSDGLSRALAATSPHDIVAFAQTVGRTSPVIDSKVCNKKVAVDDSVRQRAGIKLYRQQLYKLWSPVENVTTGRTDDGAWSCVDYEDNLQNTVQNYESPSRFYGEPGYKITVERGTATNRDDSSLSRRFNAADLELGYGEDGDGECKTTGGYTGLRQEPCRGDEYSSQNSRGAAIRDKGRWWTGKQTNRGWPGTAVGKINTAQGMAGDLVRNLTQDEKAVVAGILSETVSGAEVVEISGITVTSVIVNVCYDAGRAKLMPFVCMGLGPSFISVAQNHMSPKLSCKLKAGLSYAITPRFTVFANAYYHRVFGEEYHNVTIRHLATDVSPDGRSKNYATAVFNLAVSGADLGLRFVF